MVAKPLLSENLSPYLFASPSAEMELYMRGLLEHDIQCGPKSQQLKLMGKIVDNLTLIILEVCIVFSTTNTEFECPWHVPVCLSMYKDTVMHEEGC